MATARPEPAPRAGPLPAGSDRGRDTRERLLDAAERLFAERGFEGTSLRAITHAAGASVSAANYHFRSKEALLRATLRRRVEPVNRRRLALLQAATREAHGGGRAPTVEAVLEAFLRPTFEERAARPDVSAQFRQVAARLYSDPPERVAALKEELFHEVVERFLAALRDALPDRAPHEVALGFQFAVGVMAHVMGGNLDDAPRAFGLPQTPLPDEELLRQMTRFLAAGLGAGRAARTAVAGETP